MLLQEFYFLDVYKNQVGPIRCHRSIVRFKRSGHLCREDMISVVPSLWSGSSLSRTSAAKKENLRLLNCHNPNPVGDFWISTSTALERSMAPL